MVPNVPDILDSNKALDFSIVGKIWVSTEDLKGINLKRNKNIHINKSYIEIILISIKSFSFNVIIKSVQLISSFLMAIF